MTSARLGFLAGAQSLRAALVLLRTRRELWALCVLPVALNVALFALAAVCLLSQLDTLSAALGSWLATEDPHAWYGWLWVGPLRALAWLARGLLLAALGIAVYLLFTVVGGVLASPFLEALSSRVERIRTGAVETQEGSVVRAAGRALLEEAKRTAFFVGVQLGFFSLALLPGLQPLAAAAALAFTILFLPLEYMGYLMDRRGLRFYQRGRWVVQNPRGTLGFGAAAFATFFVPGLNFLCLPLLVTAGTLMALDAGVPPGAAGPG